jgi:hypothetical protein
MSNNSKSPSILTTQQAAAILGISEARLCLEARENHGFCKRGRWLVQRDPEKKNSWRLFREQ